MRDIIEKGIREHEFNKFNINALDKTSKEHFVKGVVENLRKDGYEGDELFEKAAKELSGGRWVTVGGNHVYIKDGKVAAGAIHTSDGGNVTSGEEVSSNAGKDAEEKTFNYQGGTYKVTKRGETQSEVESVTGSTKGKKIIVDNKVIDKQIPKK